MLSKYTLCWGLLDLSIHNLLVIQKSINLTELNPILLSTFKKIKELFLEDRSRQLEEDIFFIAISCLTPSRLSKSEA